MYAHTFSGDEISNEPSSDVGTINDGNDGNQNNQHCDENNKSPSISLQEIKTAFAQLKSDYNSIDVQKLQTEHERISVAVRIYPARLLFLCSTPTNTANNFCVVLLAGQ